ncbi:unnamed protein product [Ambrosiozyma monospora]|uniref:Squalene monooxygenase n=1 Tax=Ambrosiozyma monospora TaxID=43982 RepID=A0A9W6YKN4_AMBMO|nr:unnamed protein product [Ambrosiozyma monospora]
MSVYEQYDYIVIGAGVIGPCVATALARQGKRVLIAEREWTKPNRIVGELMQPAGLKALRQLGMIKAISNIEAVHVDGYYLSYHGEAIDIPYPDKSFLKRIDTTPVPGAIQRGDEDKLVSDSTLDIQEWDASPTTKGVAFHHGEFLMNLRAICLAEKNVTKLEGNVTGLVKDEFGKVLGIKVANKGEYKAKITINCDGIFSKFRKELGDDYVTKVGSYFIGLDLVDANLPSPNHGHVILDPIKFQNVKKL